MNFSLTDTIAAVSTPPGEGGIAVIRISGKNAFVITQLIFSKTKDMFTKINLNQEKSHTIHFGYLISDNSVIDEVLLSVFKNPHSYTGEDVIEISSHGGTYVSGKILQLILNNGARLAEPGEFTKRAFLNGRIDLSQAEAVADLIKSKTETAHTASIRQLEGSLSEFVKKNRQKIIDVTSLVELELDFADEGLEFVKKDEVKKMIINICKDIKKIIDSYIAGKVIREGVNLVIAGKPNSGKSSLFNFLLKSDRAIVSTVAGTTRDYLEESIIINGIMFNLTDTAGLRSSDDFIESEGIHRSRKKISQADLIVYLIDSSMNKKDITDEIEFFNKNFDVNKSFALMSKSDLKKNEIKHSLPEISLLDEPSVENLKNLLVQKSISVSSVSANEITITNHRHKLCLENTIKSLTDAVNTIDKNLSGEFISVDLRNAMTHLGEITGEVTNDEILNNIFRNFCIGK
ncbi:MAG: tRNA modification GTPase MnmE [Ignavibacteria bacterium]|nr:tRNA modification GTPase MnmE [Ignavibacteria bacterium]